MWIEDTWSIIWGEEENENENVDVDEEECTGRQNQHFGVAASADQSPVDSKETCEILFFDRRANLRAQMIMNGSTFRNYFPGPSAYVA